MNGYRNKIGERMIDLELKYRLAEDAFKCTRKLIEEYLRERNEEMPETAATVIKIAEENDIIFRNLIRAVSMAKASPNPDRKKKLEGIISLEEWDKAFGRR